jgi:hypothetical protein
VPGLSVSVNTVLASLERQAADWLRLAHVDRLLDYAWLEGTDPGGISYEDYRAFLPAVGFRELTRTQRGWTRPAESTGGRPAVGPGVTG